MLEVKDVAKAFGGTQALRGVSMTVSRGEIVALLGENGAGKSTLIKILAGVHPPDRGTISFDGVESSRSLRRLPVAFIHQDLGLIEWMTVAENICITLGYPRQGGMIDWSVARRRAADSLSLLNADIDPDVRVQSLSRAEKSLVAIARALAVQAQILILDEPTASLPADEVARLFAALRRLRERGVGMIYVSHRLDEVFEIGDRTVVLRDGRVAGERKISETTPAEVILLIVGREPSQVFRRPARRDGAAQLVLENVSVEDVGPVKCEIHAGEIIGFVGLRGAGQDHVGRALFGLEALSGGRIVLDRKELAIDSARAAMRCGINLIGADRAAESMMPNLSIRENMFVNPIAAGLRLLSYLAPEREGRASRALGQMVGLRPNEPDMAIELLSGGNQQKVIVGRWLHLKSKIYIFEDPTAGVDVGAKAEIYRLFDTALQAGSSIILVSTDFEEVAKVCHRALVFDRGSVVAELGAASLSIENLISAASAGVRATETETGHSGDSHAVH